MISLLNDYSEGGHPKVMERLWETNRESTEGYQFDPYCEEARALIRKKLGKEEAEIWFVPGGTLTNLTICSHVLKPHQAVVCAHTGHINVHEAGAIEATGHKVIGLRSDDGKLTREMLETCLAEHEDFFYVEPKLVYISNTTEVGTVYKKEELKALKECCEEHDLYLYMDGARLAFALGAEDNDVTWEDLGRYTDILFIGGTKCGALFGEAVSIHREDLKNYLKNTLKQKGGLFAKGRILGLQFTTLLQDGLYEEIGAKADEAAQVLRRGLRELGFEMPYDSTSNQQFFLMDDETFEKISQKVICAVEGRWPDGRCRVRFVTGWKNSMEDIRLALQAIQEVM